MITIPSGINDPSYRYKMPKMTLKQESRLNGVKTNITNIEEVASALRVPSISIMKFMTSELGANMEQSSIIKGKHVYADLLKHLDKFIEKYVLCKACRYPELRMKIEGKDLKSVCNSCGKTNSHDALHKAGKALMNHLKQGGGQIVDITQSRDIEEDVKGDEPEEIDLDEDKEQLSDLDEEFVYTSRRIVKIISGFHDYTFEDLEDNDFVLQLLDEEQKRYNVPQDFMYFIALCGLFPPNRNPVKHWCTNEKVFIELVRQEGKVGKEHFMQAVVLYFIRQYNSELSKYAETFMYKLLQENVLNHQFIVDWYEKTIRLDKEAGIYDKKAEKKFRDLLDNFMTWLKNAEVQSEGEEEEPEEKEEVHSEEEAPETAAEETDAQKRQRELIEKQRQQQAQALLEHKKKIEVEEEKMNQIMESNRENRIDITQLKNEDVDIDDI